MKKYYRATEFYWATSFYVSLYETAKSEVHSISDYVREKVDD